MSDDRVLLPPSGGGGELDRPLATLIERHMLAPARKAGVELTFAGVTKMPDGRPQIESTRWGSWLFASSSADPTADWLHRIPFPPDQLDRLKLLYQHNVDPEIISIAHQLPASYRDGDPLPRLVPDPPRMREKDEQIRRWLVKAKDAVKGVAAGFADAATKLDPLILGGMKHPDLPLVGWCVLAYWEWE